MLVAKVLEVATRATFGIHVYRYGGKNYRQMAGGPIGLRLTGVVAHVVMDKWAREFTRRLSTAQIPPYLLTKYVDDVNLVTRTIPEGLEWTKD